MNKLILILILVTVLWPLLALAQVANTPPLVTVDAVTVTNATEAFQALLHFLGFAPGQIVVILLVLKAVASYIRNFYLKNKTADQTNAVGRFVAHVAGDSLPVTPVNQPLFSK